jgi:hypothetical protein
MQGFISPCITDKSSINTVVSPDDGHINGKAVPLQVWSGPEGSRKLRFPDFMTTAQDGGNSKGTAVPLQAWSGPEGSRKLRFPDFMITAQDGGKVVSLTHRPPLPPRNYNWYSFLLEAESTPGP